VGECAFIQGGAKQARAAKINRARAVWTHSPRKPCRSPRREMRRSYLDYAMSVIVAALARRADGLKPVHRRVLFAMYEAGNL